MHIAQIKRMKLKKNIQVGKTDLLLSFFLIIVIFFSSNSNSSDLEGKNTNIKILDKISSKNILIKLQNGKELKYKDLSIKSMKCSNSEFDDNPEVIAYIQVRDLTNKDKDNVFIFNGWIFSSSPSIKPFDHAVYDIWLIGCN